MIIKEYYAPVFLGDRMLIHMISDDLQLSSDKKGELIQDYYKNNESKLLKWAKLIKKKCPRFFDDFIEIADLEDAINENIMKGKSKMIVKEERIPKYKNVTVLQGNYGYGWDDLCYYEDNAEGRKEQKDDIKTYRENEPGVSFRIITRKEPNPDYKAPTDRFRVYPVEVGYNRVYKNGDTKKFTDVDDAIDYALSLNSLCVLKDVVTGKNLQVNSNNKSMTDRNLSVFKQVISDSNTNESLKETWLDDADYTAPTTNAVTDESVRKNRKLKEAESYGWIVETNQVWEAYDLACDYFGRESVDRAIVDTLSDNALASSLAYLFRMWDFREWDEYLASNNEDEDFEDEEFED